MKGKEVPVLRVVKVSCEVTYRVFIIKVLKTCAILSLAKS